MKKLLFIIVSVAILVCFAGHSYARNKIIYYDAHWRPLPDKTHAIYYRTVAANKGTRGNYLITDRYYGSKKTQMIGSYDCYTDENSRNGYFTYFDTTGKKALEGLYTDSTQDSVWKYYYTTYNDEVDFNFRLEDTDQYYYTINYRGIINVCDSLNVQKGLLYDFRGFSYVDFTNHFNISDAVFYNNALMFYNTFNTDANFINDTFISVDLSHCVFNDELIFCNNYVNNILSFANDTFYKKVTINNIGNGKNGQINFNNTLLPDTVDFSHNDKINNKIDLLVANFKSPARYDANNKKYTKPHYINLYKSDISEFHLDYFHFKLYFPPGLANDEINSVYEALLNNFKNRGQTESYQSLDIEYKNFKYIAHHQHWLSYVDKWWWNYGYGKDLVFAHAALFLFFFTFITFMILGFLNDEVYSMDDITYIIPSRMKKYRNTDLGKKAQDSTTYTVAANNKLSAINKNDGLAINVQVVQNEKDSIYTKEYKTIIYCLFLGAFTVFLFSFYRFEQFLLGRHMIAAVLHHRSVKIAWGAVITALILALWIFRGKLSGYKVVDVFDKVLTRSWLSLVYTSKLFFPLFIKIENLKYKHQLLVFYILFVYLVGLLCVGYMTNFVFQK